MQNEQTENGQTYEQKIAAALYEWKRLQDRRQHPDGTFDSAGRWYPSDAEKCECCAKIRSPSRAYPYSYMTHCRSVEHVANKFGVAVKDLRRETRACSLARAENAQ